MAHKGRYPSPVQGRFDLPSERLAPGSAVTIRRIFPAIIPSRRVAVLGSHSRPLLCLLLLKAVRLLSAEAVWEVLRLAGVSHRGAGRAGFPRFWGLRVC